MSDKDAPLDKCLLEILVYLETLGCNIQKRTQNLIEKRINKNYLSSPESIQKVVEKINLICDLSKASIDKVQNGVKKTVESHLKITNPDSSDALDRVSLDGRESGQLSEKILKKPPTSRSLEDSARKEITLPKVKTEQNKNFKKVVYEDNTLFINENIILDDYLRCSVKLNWFPLEYFDKYKEVEADDILGEFEDSKKRVNEHVHSKKIKSYSGSSKESNVIDKSETSKSCSSKYKSSKKARVSESESDKAIMKKRNMKSTEESSDYEDTERSTGKKQDENYYKTEERDERGLSKPEGESESTREYSQEIELDFLMKGDEGVGSNKIENVDSNIDTVIGDKKVKEDPEDLGIGENKTTSPNKKKTPHSRSKEKRNKRKSSDQSDEKLNESSENNKEPKSKNERADKSCKRNRDKSEGNSSKEEKRKESQRECHKEKSDKSEYHDKSDENSNKVCIDKSKDVSKENHKGKSDKSDRKKYTHKSKKPFKRIICDSSGSEDEKNDKDDISNDVLQEKEACKNTLKVEHALDSVLFEKENVENDSGVENNAAIFNAKVDSPECSNSSSNDIQKKLENKESDKNLNVSDDSPSTQCNIDIVESLSRTAKGDDELVVQSCESLNEAEISTPCDPEDQIENRYNGETSKVLENKKSNVTEESLHSNENRSNTELPSEDKSEDNSESEHSNIVDFDRFSEDSNDLLSKAETRSKKNLNSKLETKKVNKQGSTSINEFCESGEENMNKTNKESNADKECEENAESISASAHSEKVSDSTLAVDDNITNNVNASDDQCDKENEPELGVEKCASGTCNKEIESNLNVPDVQCNKETEPDIDVKLDALGEETESYLDVSDVQFNKESQPKNTETEPNHGNEPESNSIAAIEHKLDTETESKSEAENELKSDETESQPETKNDLKLDEETKSKPAAETKLKNDEANSQSSENIEECQTSDQPKESKESSSIIPLIRCVNIQNLLDPSKNVSNDKSQDLPAKKPKMVTFFDKPIQITNRKKVSEKPLVNFTKKPSSILLKTKVTYASETRLSHDKVEIISSDSDSDISSTTRELMKRIKSNILDGNCNVYVSLTRDPIHSSVYTNSLTDIGINKVYNESGDLCSKDKVKELNENAKRAVLNSSSSDSDQDAPGSTKSTKKSTNSSFSSDIEFSDKNESFSTHKKTKKFSKKRHKKHIHSDSDTEINNLTSLPKKRKKMSKMNTSDESSSNKDKQMTDTDESEDEMGRSLRLKGRTEQAALPDQSTQDRNGSDSSSSSKVEDSKKKSKEDSTLLDTMLNGNLKSEMASDAEHSSESGSGGKSKSKTFSGKPILESIKNDLLEDETSSSARESPPKINGKDKGGKQFKEEDESDEEDPGSQEDRDKSDSDSDNISKKRSNSVIDLNSESDDSDVKPKRKGKKTQQNGKGSNSDDGDDKAASGSNTDESEIFVSSKRKRKQKKKSSDESSDDSKKSETSMKKRRRIKKLSGDESSAESGSDSDGETRKGGRKNIRALKKSSHLDSATRIAARKERERIARITERQKLYNESMFDESGRPDEVVKLDKVVLDFDPKTKEPSISVDKGLVEKLKPHQANGIKFMWDACFESVKQIKESKGSGCILAHCMGLGKTLQVVTLTHTLLTHQDHTKVERVLVVCPLSTVLNWVNEFRMWLEHSHAEDEINIFELSKYKQNYERSNQLKEWLECGGVCILGYDMFRNLSADNPKKFRKAQLSAFQKALVDPGPDLVVCDEGHLLKNEKTSLSQSMNRIKTLRRIVLTGTPLQNNLKEYYCMVQFVKPNLLGKYNEYLNRFVNPITNGQYTNSTEHDIRVMKRRSHVLHKMLDGAVQRRDYAVLAPFLPPKHEYVLFISLTEIQIKLYAHYLENYSRRPNPDRKTTPSLFSDFQSLQRIWTHPLVLKANSERYELMQQKKRDKEEEDESEGSLADFIDDEEDTTTPEETSASESVDSDDSDDNRKKKKSDKKGKNSKTKHSRLTRATAGTKGDDENIDDDIVELKTEEPTRAENPTEWWMSLCSEDELNDVKHSNKLLILLDILKMCDAIGDKLLVFSQSLYSLDLIEQFLSKIDESTQKTEKDDDHLAGHVGSWASGLDYFRLDGSTSCENRAIWCKAFNREDNPRARLFLISTRAGGLGINLVAANRVVIFDMSWNPSHDVQSIFRVYRFGQKKPCYIYRFLALGTMEEKIYERQVTKQAISKRVIDEQQIDRHYTESDLAELYIFNPVPEGPREVPNLPKDRLFADLLKQHDTVIYKYHEHDSLLENKEEETLTEEERKAAWDDYENEKTKPPPAVGNSWLVNFQQQQQQQQMTINALSAVLRQDYPTLSEQQITTMIPSILQQMYSNGDASLMQKMSAMMAAQSNMMGGQNSMMTGFKYPQNILPQGMMMNPGTMGVSMRGGPMYQQAAWQQQQQLQLQRLQQQQAMQANLKYYAGGLGSRDMIDMAALQQQQRALLLSSSVAGQGTTGTGTTGRGRPSKQHQSRLPQEVVDLDSE